MKRIGHCQIVEKYGNNAYKVDLPDKMGISPMFNIEYLVA